MGLLRWGKKLYYNIVFVWSQYDGRNIDKEQLAEVPSKTKDAKLKIVGGDFIWIPTTRSWSNHLLGIGAVINSSFTQYNMPSFILVQLVRTICLYLFALSLVWTRISRSTSHCATNWHYCLLQLKSIVWLAYHHGYCIFKIIFTTKLHLTIFFPFCMK